MSTRCVTVVRSRFTGAPNWNHHATIYRHSDGYPEGQGTTLAEILDGVSVINGRTFNEPPNAINGPGELAAFIVHRMFVGGHNPNLYEQGAVVGQEFEYHVLVDYSAKGGDVSIEAFSGPITAFGFGGEQCNQRIFSGDLQAFVQFIKDHPYGVDVDDE